MRSLRAFRVPRPGGTGPDRHWILLALALSCAGQIDPGSGSGGPPSPGGTPPGGGGPTPPGAAGPLVSRPGPTSRFVRLNHQQWENTVRDLFKLPAPLGLSAAFVAEPLRSTFDTNGSLLSVALDQWQDYQTGAEAVASKVVKDRKLLGTLVPAAPADAAGKGKAFVQSFGLRAFRRPLTDEEVGRYAALFDKGGAVIGSGDAVADGVELVIAALLQSPHFLYRTELATTVVAGKVPLGDHEVAAKLSYALTNSMPDDALFAAAAARQLTTRNGVLEQAKRLLGPAAEATSASFHDQLLRMREFEQVKKEHPLFTAGVGADLKQEALMFVKSVIVEQDRGFADLFTAPFTYANSRIARIYGLSAPPPAAGRPDPFVRVDLDPTQRAGLLTQVGFLASHGEGATPNIIMRGVHIAKDVLCVDVPPPPDAIPPVPAIAANSTNRQRIETLTKDAPCSTCHPPLINPLGFALEKLDGVGAFRTQENGQPIDASGSYTLDGKTVTFDGAVALARAIAESQQGHACYARHWIEYLYGREVDQTNEADRELVARAGALSKSNPSAKNLILNLVSTEAFVARLP